MAKNPSIACRPIAIPFKLGYFLQPRQLDLERELNQSPTLARLEELESGSSASASLSEAFKAGIALCEGFSPVLDESVARLRTVARLPWPVEVALVPHARRLTCRARFQEDRLQFVLSPTFFECAPSQLVFLLAIATFNAIHDRPRRLAWLCEGTAPVDLPDRLRIIDLLRFQAYAASCFGLISCQDLEVAAQQVFFRQTGLDPARSNVNALRLASHHLQHHPSPVAALVGSAATRFSLLPAETMVLQRFAASSLYLQCLGEEGGTSREQFEAEVMELDRQAHPPMTRLPDDQLEFVALASVLAGRHVMEATGPLTPRRYRRCLDFYKLEQEQVDQLTRRHLDCLLEDANDDDGVLGKPDWMPRSKAGTLMAHLVGGAHAPWTRVHSATILKHAILLGLKEHDGRCPRRVLQAIEEVGRCCLLDLAHVMTLFETVRKDLQTEA